MRNELSILKEFQASGNCLIKIINSDKYYEEEFSKKIAEEGIVKAIHITFRNGIEKSPESYAVKFFIREIK
jgi:hypothetical protein